jgi:hypothetical protein
MLSTNTMRGIRRQLATRIRLPRWLLWVFLGFSCLLIVYAAARNWHELNVARSDRDETPPVVPELLAPIRDDAIRPPVTLRWSLPLGPTPATIIVRGPSYEIVLSEDCPADSLVLTSHVLNRTGVYWWRVVPKGLPAAACPEERFVVEASAIS